MPRPRANTAAPGSAWPLHDAFVRRCAVTRRPSPCAFLLHKPRSGLLLKSRITRPRRSVKAAIRIATHGILVPDGNGDQFRGWHLQVHSRAAIGTLLEALHRVLFCLWWQGNARQTTRTPAGMAFAGRGAARLGRSIAPLD